ncbi:MAG TPA: RecQ family ATP-dependent DNA helicase [Candidatus Butyricicoccus avistercoris]|uniref:DNA 3'-5' helicase n=1 Tax=Candidatus Butyricicoccus avistercoris TaxID=2838518 RepID=A0A9D1PJ78_9FIRM|nr:RecQ family ATP-dependent DNA helicase [Candidatus Butyricicoccus avistercoris]
MDIKSNIKMALKELNYSDRNKQQIKAIKSLSDGNDTFIIAGTGFGKTAIYTTAGYMTKDKLTLVIEPLLALMHNQVDTLQKRGVKADYIDHTRKDTDDIIKQAVKGKLNFLYVSAERLQYKSFIKQIIKADIGMIVIDECHCITQYGYTFRDAYLKIGDFISKLRNRPVICACSATVSKKDISTITDLLNMQQPNIIKCNLKRNNLILIKKDATYEHKSREKQEIHRIDILKKQIKKYHSDGSVIIYCLTRNAVDFLFDILEEKYPNQVVRSHSGIEPAKLKNQMEIDFLTGKKKIMIATSTFSMGIDVPDIELVVHYNSPISMTDYIQQIGRAGRDGRTAHCVLMYNKSDDEIVNALKKNNQFKDSKKIINKQYKEVKAFINSTNCMNIDILEYQGEEQTNVCKKCTCCARNRRGKR